MYELLDGQRGPIDIEFEQSDDADYNVTFSMEGVLAQLACKIDPEHHCVILVMTFLTDKEFETLAEYELKECLTAKHIAESAVVSLTELINFSCEAIKKACEDYIEKHAKLYFTYIVGEEKSKGSIMFCIEMGTYISVTEAIPIEKLPIKVTVTRRQVDPYK